MRVTPRHTLQLTRPLLHWLAADPLWQQLPLAWRAGAAWRATWGSVNTHLSATAHPRDTAPLPDPLLIVGPWRSGTTVMHELLVAATGAVTPQTWQCMNAAAFQLGRAPRAGVALARPMDGLEIRADSPQEDEFALLTLGVPSAYRAFLMPHRLEELADTLDPHWWQVHTEWLAVWEGLLRGVMHHAGSARLPLILKSPNHTFRLPAIMARFPAARVVWMARPAMEVFLSNRKMWHAMFAAHGLTSSIDEAALDGFLALALRRAAQVLEWCTTELPLERCVVVQHAALRARPEAATRALWQLLAGQAVDEAALQRAATLTARGRVEAYAPMDLIAELAAAVSELDRVQQAALARHGVG
jgi:hypothetical protein